MAPFLDVQAQRRRLEKGKAAGPCALCGSDDVVLVESVAVRRGVHRINPFFRRRARRYERCRSCRAKHGYDEGRRSRGRQADAVAGKLFLALLLAVVTVELVLVVGLAAVLVFTGAAAPIAVAVGMLLVGAVGCLLTLRVARRAG